MRECAQSNNFEQGLKWDELNNALEKIGVATYLGGLSDKREIERLLDKSQKLIARNQSNISNNNVFCSTIS